MRQQVPHPTGGADNDEVRNLEMSDDNVATHENSERLPRLCLSKVDPADRITGHAKSECKSSMTHASPNLTASIHRATVMWEVQVG
jgi:hypothetical protein